MGTVSIRCSGTPHEGSNDDVKQANMEGLIRMRIDDELLDKLGTYFVYHKVFDRYGMTFESFVDRWNRGILEL